MVSQQQGSRLQGSFLGLRDLDGIGQGSGRSLDAAVVAGAGVVVGEGRAGEEGGEVVPLGSDVVGDLDSHELRN